MTDLARHMEAVARLLLGDPNPRLSKATELRYGTNGSLAIDLTRGIFNDYEHDSGGGVIALVRRQLGLADDKEAVEWLIDKGFLDKPKEPQRIVATYDYTDAAGRLVFQVVRFHPKDFRQRQPGAKNGGWIWNLDGVRRVPYRLPQLLAAIAADRTIPVFITEGEKDADRLAALGLTATCNPGGASKSGKAKGKWRDELTPYFLGADVVILPDNDDAGRAHARLVATKLHNVAASIRILELPGLPEKGDVSDWLDAGHHVDEFLALAETAPIWEGRADDGNDARTARRLAAGWSEAEALLPPLTFLKIAEWDNEPVPPREWAVPERIPARQPTLFSGEGAAGKSIIELQLAVAHVLGRDWLGLWPTRGPAIYVGAEDDADELHRRLADIAGHYDASFSELERGGLSLLSYAGEDCLLGVANPKTELIEPTPLYKLLFEAAQDIRPAHIGIDTSADVFGGEESNRTQVRQFVGLLRKLAMAANGAVVLLSHPSLTGIISGTGLSGSTAWHNNVRARMYLRPPKAEDDKQPDSDLRELEFMKNNYGPLSHSIVLRYQNGLFLPEGGVANLGQAEREQTIDATFLDVLAKLLTQSRRTSHKPRAENYAPKAIAAHPDGRAFATKDYAAAMERLLARNAIHIATYGRPSNPYEFLALGPRKDA
jgi:RecA-family ATPase